MKSEIYNVNFYDQQSKESFLSAQKVFKALFKSAGDKFNFESIIDFGCGVGSWLAAAKNAGFKRVVGLDGDYVPRDRLMIGQDEFHPTDLGEIGSRVNDQKFDLAISLEVAEHLEREVADDFVKALSESADFILFSAAVPYQGGHGHVNENWLEYWVSKFESNGLVAIDLIRPNIWDDTQVCWWYRQNIMCFVRPSLLAKLPSGTTINSPKSLIHPQQFIVAAHRKNQFYKYNGNQDARYFDAMQNGDFDSFSMSYGTEHKSVANKSGPDFLCIGIQKSGTTWLYEQLKSHPKIDLPIIKEICYFSQLYIKSHDWAPNQRIRQAESWIKSYSLNALSHKQEFIKNMAFLSHFVAGPINRSWYANLFSKNHDLVTGDFSPDYSLIDKESVQKIKTEYPDLKAILMLRCPVQRTWSHIKMSCKQEGIEMTDIDMVSRVMNRADVLDRGYIKRHYQNWKEIFGEDLLVLDFDKISESPLEVLGCVTSFLNLEFNSEQYKSPQEKVFSGEQFEIPSFVSDFLQEKYEEDLEFYKLFKAKSEFKN